MKRTKARPAKRKTRARTRVGRSKIQGRGVFATARIRKATRILEYVGEIVDRAEAVRRAARRKIVLLFDLEDGNYLDGNPDAPGPCVNHSCDPNCFTDTVGQRVFIIAGRTIEPGEELTYDYSIREGEILGCICGAATCRGTLNLPSKPKRKRRETRRSGRKSR